MVLIDGREVNTPLFAGTYRETQHVMLEDVDRIEVIRGPGGTIRGPNAVNSVQLDLTYRYVSQLPAQSVPAYSSGDARIGWQLAPRLELPVVGRNLFQPHHPEYAGDALIDIRRSIYAMLSWGR